MARSILSGYFSVISEDWRFEDVEVLWARHRDELETRVGRFDGANTCWRCELTRWGGRLGFGNFFWEMAWVWGVRLGLTCTHVLLAQTELALSWVDLECRFMNFSSICSFQVDCNEESWRSHPSHLLSAMNYDRDHPRSFHGHQPSSTSSMLSDECIIADRFLADKPFASERRLLPHDAANQQFEHYETCNYGF